MINQKTDKVYIRIDDEEVFVKDRKTGMFYNKGMQCFKNKGHLVSEFAEEHLDSLVEKGLFKRVIVESKANNMTIPELITQTNNQVSLLKKLVDSHADSIKDYPKGGYELTSLTKLEHCYNTLLTLNELLAKPIS